jgi:DNA-directed RNA polymerase subunit L
MSEHVLTMNPKLSIATDETLATPRPTLVSSAMINVLPKSLS